MKSCVGSTEGEGIDWDMSHLAIVDSLTNSEEGAVESSLGEAVASVNPDVLVVPASINESRKFIVRMSFQVVSLIAEINVAGNLRGHY